MARWTEPPTLKAMMPTEACPQHLGPVTKEQTSHRVPPTHTHRVELQAEGGNSGVSVVSKVTTFLTVPCK